MRPIAIGKFRKPAKPVSMPPPDYVPPRRLAEPQEDVELDVAMARRVIALRRWRGISNLS